MTNDDVVFGGGDPTNDMHESGGGRQSRAQGRRRSPLVTGFAAILQRAIIDAITLVIVFMSSVSCK